jgi:hypothetical protein
MLNLFQHLSSRGHCEERSDEAIFSFRLLVILNLIQDLVVLRAFSFLSLRPLR